MTGNNLKKEGISYLHSALLMFQGAEDWAAVDELNKLIGKLENRFQIEEQGTEQMSMGICYMDQNRRSE